MARDGGQWSEDAQSQWFRSLMQPDNPHLSCCGEADAYWSDSYEVEGDHYVAIITDERPDDLIGRPHVPPGTRIPVPNSKMKYDAGNPTGHGVIFLQLGTRTVYCFVAPGGV